MFKYYVVFQGQRMGQSFIGSTEYTLKKPIDSIHAIREMEQDIKEEGKSDWVTITFWKELKRKG